MKTRSKLCPRCVWSLVRRLLWKREVARAEWQMWAMQREIDILKNARDVANDCYRENLDNLTVANRSAEEWRRKYYEARKYLREANRGAQRNAMVAELAHARLSRPNTHVTDAEPSTPANTRAQSPRSV